MINSKNSESLVQIAGHDEWVPFDLDYYVDQCGIDFVDPEEGFKHFSQIGWREGYDPTPEFSTLTYLEKYPDIAAAQVNPYIHFHIHGKNEGRVFSPSNILAVIQKSKNKLKKNTSPNPAAPDEEAQRPVVDAAANRPSEPDEALQTTSDDEAPSDISSTEPSLEVALHAEPSKPKALVAAVNAADTAGQSAPMPFNRAFYEKQVGIRFRNSKKALEDYLQRGWLLNVSPAPELTNERAIAEFPENFPSVEKKEKSTLKNVEPKPLPPELAANEEIAWQNFDANYYRQENKDLASLDDWAAFRHYMTAGWQERRDPCLEFSTSHYLKNSPDIAAAKINPFLHYLNHGKKESRPALPYHRNLLVRKTNPLVSVIVPNFNHAKFLKERINSILGQSYENIELIVLDDCSTDNSREVISALTADVSIPVQLIFNEKNSGGVFRQWEKGFKAAKGDLIWICESDDLSELDFLTKIIPQFSDPSVMLAFGRIQFCDAKGIAYPGLDNYREQTEAGIWNNVCVRPAAQWFRGAFAASNIIPNVGGCVFRNQEISSEIWNEAQTYRISGDWYLYLVLSRGGQIAYVPSAVTYFRQHGKNTSVKGFLRKEYYTEHEKIARKIRSEWGTSASPLSKLYSNVVTQFEYAKAEEHVGPIEELVSFSRILHEPRVKRHVLIAFLGFHLGGGEIFPINLANELHRQGLMVSVLSLDGIGNQNSAIRNILDPSIPVYEGAYVQELGVDQFIRNAGIDLIHSHAAAVEFFFFQRNRLTANIPYLVTLHGSYEVTPMPDDLMYRVLRSVDHWFYLADKNLKHLARPKLHPDTISQVRNGMPLDDRPFPISRADLGIPENSFVLGLASRAIVDKGWKPAMDAVELLQSKFESGLYLCICGDGSDFEQLQTYALDKPHTRLLGYQERIDGFYAMCDAAILPSRFQGESFPLCLIQAMQAGLPIVATDIGEISKMLQVEDLTAGVLVQTSEEDEEFVNNLVEAISCLGDPSVNEKITSDSVELGKSYALSTVAAGYAEYYQKYLTADRKS